MERYSNSGTSPVLGDPGRAWCYHWQSERFLMGSQSPCAVDEHISMWPVTRERTGECGRGGEWKEGMVEGQRWREPRKRQGEEVKNIWETDEQQKRKKMDMWQVTYCTREIWTGGDRVTDYTREYPNPKLAALLTVCWIYYILLFCDTWCCLAWSNWGEMTRKTDGIRECYSVEVTAIQYIDQHNRMSRSIKHLNLRCTSNCIPEILQYILYVPLLSTASVCWDRPLWLIGIWFVLRRLRTSQATKYGACSAPLELNWNCLLED